MGYNEHIWFHQCQEDINCLHHCERIPEDTPGAYVSLKNELIQNIKYHVNPGTEKKKNKISGEFSRISNFVALSFSLITDDLTL